jgi:hypothetical protein
VLLVPGERLGDVSNVRVIGPFAEVFQGIVNISDMGAS